MLVSEPNIDELVVFGKLGNKNKPIPNSSKQLIGREIELIKLRGFETNKPATDNKIPEKKMEVDKELSVPNHLKTLQFKQAPKKNSSCISLRTTLRVLADHFWSADYRLGTTGLIPHREIPEC
ncbi:unnamed protein product [Ceutorhynchus assimilis]|uniref:Uncharacterized protein n=1 Tax=Ceutorhynchus assimilis TaxID=467358 RepID=A0A9N9N2J1_9CUCU|nr:unnamed protein product [Ceutorhynchus assimilis]